MKPVLITPNWILEQRILRLRSLLGALFVVAQLSGIYRLEWSVFWVFMLLGAFIMGLNLVGLVRRWHFLPSLNLLLDQILTVAVLSVSGGAAGPYLFLIYLHVLSATIFLRDVKMVVLIGSVQVALLFISSIFILLSGGDPHWSNVILHSLGLMIIATTLVGPAKGLYEDAETDPLTGALNRRSGVRELKRWLTLGQPFSLLFADLKKFKRINDTYGHATGDKVLQSLAHHILETVRDSDLVIRYGGDEFVIVTQGDAAPMTERLRDILAQPIPTPTAEVTIEIDFGVARYPEDAQTLDELIHFADQHMFSVKRKTVQAKN